ALDDDVLRRPLSALAPALLAHREPAHARLAGEAGVDPFEVLVEEAEELAGQIEGDSSISRVGTGLPGDAIVPRSDEEPALGRVERQVALDRRVRVGPIEPTSDREDGGAARAHAVDVGRRVEDVERPRSERRIVLVVTMNDVVGQSVDVDVAYVLAEG